MGSVWCHCSGDGRMGEGQRGDKGGTWGGGHKPPPHTHSDVGMDDEEVGKAAAVLCWGGVMGVSTGTQCHHGQQVTVPPAPGHTTTTATITRDTSLPRPPAPGPPPHHGHGLQGCHLHIPPPPQLLGPSAGDGNLTAPQSHLWVPTGASRDVGQGDSRGGTKGTKGVPVVPVPPWGGHQQHTAAKLCVTGVSQRGGDTKPCARMLSL